MNFKDQCPFHYSGKRFDETADTLTVKCEVISADRKRLTAVYKGDRMSNGAAYPVSVFYTNTVDLNQVRNLGLSDYTDGYTNGRLCF